MVSQPARFGERFRVVDNLCITQIHPNSQEKTPRVVVNAEER